MKCTPAPKRKFRLIGTDGGHSMRVSVATCVAVLALWWLVTSLGLVRSLFLPSPDAVLARFRDVALDGFGGATLAQHSLASLGRVLAAFGLACVTGVPLGLGMGVSRIMRSVLDPPVEFYRPIPPLAYLPLTIIWLGIGELSKIVLIYLACLAPIVISTRAGVRSVHQEQIRAAYSLGGDHWQVLFHVVVRAAMPEMLTGMRIAMGFGWTTLVAAEMVAATRGLGFMILNASEFLVTDVVLLGILVIGLIALASDYSLRLLERRFVPWKGRG